MCLNKGNVCFQRDTVSLFSKLVVSNKNDGLCLGKMSASEHEQHFAVEQEQCLVSEQGLC